MGVCLNLKGNFPSFSSQWVNRGKRDCGDILKMPAVQNNNLKCGECGLWESLTVKGLEDSNRADMLEYLKTHECEPGTVVYKRHLTAGVVHSFALPFGVKQSQLPEGCDLYVCGKGLEFDDNGNPKIPFTGTDEVSANTPFFLVSERVVDLQITNFETTKKLRNNITPVGSATYTCKTREEYDGVVYEKGSEIKYSVAVASDYRLGVEVIKTPSLGGYHYFAGMTDTGLSILTASEPFRAEFSITVTTPGVDANCVMMYGSELPGKLYCIDISRANKFWSNSDVSDLANVIGETTEWTAEVIWQDIPLRAISFCDAAGANLSDTWDGVGLTNALWVKNTGSTPGNVVIGIKKRGATEYLWSWHLWITAEPKLVGGFMDRNLGATSATPSDGDKTYGLYYQFGRKDPFTGDIDRYDINGNPIGKTPVAPGGVTFVKAIQTPQVFYYRSYNPYDWVSPNNYVSKKWNDITDAYGKSLFDPSPQGWRLSSSEEYALMSEVSFPWDDTNKGRFYEGNGYPSIGYHNWFPSAGFRLCYDRGDVVSIGNYGNYSTPSPRNADEGYVLSFYSGYVSCNGFVPRANGCSVRCVPE